MEVGSGVREPERILNLTSGYLTRTIRAKRSVAVMPVVRDPSTDNQPRLTQLGITYESSFLNLAVCVAQVGRALANPNVQCSTPSRSSQALSEGCTEVGVSIASDRTR